MILFTAIYKGKDRYLFMKTHNKLQSMVISALLCAIGIIIPMFAPKIVLEPASFTLASHVPIFIAMFISPSVAISVSLITGLGFLFAGFPLIIVLRALTHVSFASLGSFMLKKNNHLLHSPVSTFLFGFLLAVVHALCEVIVVTLFYMGNNMSSAYYENGYLMSVIVLVGIGTIIHSMVDYGIALFVWKPVHKMITIPTNVNTAK